MSMYGNTPQYGRNSGGQPLDYGYEAAPGVVSTFFNAVYAWMATGLALTAVVGWWVSTRPDVMQRVFSGGMLLGLFVVELLLVGVISAATRKLNATVATGLFLVYAALNGVTLSGIFIVYKLATIGTAFAACAVMFGAMSIWGMATKSDLTGLGKICIMGLIGIIIATVVNIFLHNNAMTWLVSYIGVAVFTGLTAYDTQKLKQLAIATGSDQAMAARFAVNGALMLYLDFLNLFLFLLQILGDRRR